METQVTGREPLKKYLKMSSTHGSHRHVLVRAVLHGSSSRPVPHGPVIILCVVHLIRNLVHPLLVEVTASPVYGRAKCLPMLGEIET